MKASGILNWPRGERITDRYGLINLHEGNYSDTERTPVHIDLDALRRLEGFRCTISVRVTKARRSGHIGDFFRSIYPATPEVGEVIDLGTGALFLDLADRIVSFGIRPDDGRTKDWFDPHKLYRLHDQTVEIDIEPERSGKP